MASSKQLVESYYMDFLRCAICSHDFEYENPLYRPITLPICGHTMCTQCIYKICNKTECPKDQVSFGINHIPINQLPTNYPLLTILYDPLKLPSNEERYGECASYTKLDGTTKFGFKHTEKLFCFISLMIKPIINNKERQSILSRSMIQKIFSLLNSQYINREGCLKVLEAARSLGEHICMDLILHHQNPQQLKELNIDDKLSTRYLSPNSIQEFENLLKYAGNSSELQSLVEYFKVLYNIDPPNNNQENHPNDIRKTLQVVINILQCVIEFKQKKKKRNKLSYHICSTTQKIINIINK